MIDKTGETLSQEQVYSVLVSDFLYAGGDGLDMLASFDPDAYDTAVDWRQPVIDWITAQQSNEGEPLDLAIDSLQ